MSGRRARAGWLVVLALVAAACSGSGGDALDVTSLLDDQRSGPGSVARGQANGGTAVAGGAGAVDARPGTGATAAGRRGVPGGGSGGDRGRASISGPGPTGGGDHPPVKVGVRYMTGIDQLANMLGASGFSVPDTRAMAEALVTDLNRRGGLAGHPIEAVYHAYDASNPAGTAGQEQEACSFFAEDHHVAIVISGFFSSDVLQTCLARRGVVLVDENYGFFDMALSPETYFVPGFPDPVRSAGALVDSLVARGFFGDDPRIGITMKDTPDRHRVAAGIEAALHRHGLQVDDSIRYTTDHPEAISSGILRFRSSRISHVFILDIGGLESGVIMQQAESQGYRPRYAVDTRNVPIYLASNAPPEQLRGAAGIGWAPSTDVGRGPGSEPGPPEQRCQEVMRQAGVELRDAGNDKLAYAYCDVVFLLEAATAQTGDVAPPAIAGGVESLGAGYRPVGGFAARFGPGRHDGASGARAIRFADGCGCFEYTDDIIDLG